MPRMSTPVRWFAIELTGSGPPEATSTPDALLRALLAVVERWDANAQAWFVRGRSSSTFAADAPDAFARALAVASPNPRDLERGKPSLLAASAANDDEVELTWPASGGEGAWRVACRLPLTEAREKADFAELGRQLADVTSWGRLTSGFLAPDQRDLPAPSTVASSPAASPPTDATLDVQSPLPDTTLPFAPIPSGEHTVAIDPAAKLLPSESDFRHGMSAAPVPDMSLEQYAAFHTELRLKGGVDASMAIRYGVPSEAVQRALIQGFRNRFAADAALAERFAALVRAMTGTYGGGRTGG